MKITHEVHISFDFDAYTNSRLALKKLIENEGFSVKDLKSDLILESYQQLPHYPEFITSISHTKGAGAAVLGLKNEYLSLGIDIEWSNRLLKDEAQRFFRHQADSNYENNLELWTMKEAAFKALSPLGHPGVLVLSKIIIQNGIFWSEAKPNLKGEIQTSKIIFDKKEMVMSIATITKQESSL